MITLFLQSGKLVQYIMLVMKVVATSFAVCAYWLTVVVLSAVLTPILQEKFNTVPHTVLMFAAITLVTIGTLIPLFLWVVRTIARDLQLGFWAALKTVIMFRVATARLEYVNKSRAG